VEVLSLSKFNSKWKCVLHCTALRGIQLNLIESQVDWRGARRRPDRWVNHMELVVDRTNAGQVVRNTGGAMTSTKFTLPGLATST